MSKKTVRIGIGAFLLIIGSLFYLMNMYTPICGDDYLYSFYLTPVAAKSFFEGASIGFEQKISSFTDVIFSQYNHYFYVNGRTIPHILEQSFAGLWGENCFNLINVFAFLLLNMLVIWISGKRNLTKFGYWVAAVFFIWFLLPCPVDLFLLMSGALNYTWSAVSTISIQGNYTGEGTFFLGEIPPFVDMFKVEKVENKTPLSNGSFNVQLDRYVTIGDYEYDRLLSKWAIYKEGASKDEIVSHARYANVDKIHVKQSVEAIPLKSKKGLGGLINHGFLASDLDDLGIASATINIPISHFMHLSQQEGDIPHTYGGRTYYFNEGYMKSSFDAVLAQTSERGISVAGILLVPPTGDAGTLLKHPDFNGIAPYTMPNMTTIESTNCYAAALDFLAERYSDPNMRIAHWIIHNEVDGGSHWTNMGDKPIATFMDTYLRSMRMCYNIAHQYDQHSEVFISFSHGWNIAAGGGWYKVRDMLDFMNQFSESEGDFFWSLACHSYPAQLGNPCTWDDEQATYSMDTEYVTLKNLEVLDKWVSLSSNKYKGTVKRSVWLSEAGTCSPSYSDNDLQDQAAGFAYGWKKINNLDGIDGIQWHSWFDHLGDGACLGLRKYTEAPHNGEAKPVWTTYQKADTDEEDDYFEQYLSRIGIDSWEGIIQDIP